MKPSQIACQLYTVRDHLKTPRDIAASLKRVRAIGYEAVQVSCLGPIADDELAKILRGEGLTCCGTHEDGARLLSDPGSLVDRLRKLDCGITTYPWPGDTRFGSLIDVRSFALKLNAAGKILHEAGITFCYHNHHMEFRRVGGRAVLEVIYTETDPRYLQAELDTYWIQFGGGDPEDWCRWMKDRLVNLHMKDYGIGPDNQVVFAEVGSGNLDWPSIVSAAQDSGCRWFIVEQDTCPGDPFDSLKQSYDFVRKNLCRG
ncbi:MAG: sugar phosphate isomerase/epimerase [Verrucomicrobiota bacterium]